MALDATEAGFPRFKILTPYPAERFRGRLSVDGKEWVVEGWPGMQGHNWGRAHSERYAWAHCCAFEGRPESWFEGFSAKIRLGPVTTPFLTMLSLVHEGRVCAPRSLGAFSPRSKSDTPCGASGPRVGDSFFPAR